MLLKRYFFVIFTVFFFLIMLSSPDVVFLGARSGLILWFQTVLPTLLPFLIIVNVMQKTSLISFISHLVSPLLCPLFKISQNGCFAILTGFLCGYPMGAKVTADLVRSRKITRREGSYLLSFCNHTSPGFMAGFVICQILQKPEIFAETMTIFFLIPVCMSFLFRRFHRVGEKDKSDIVSCQYSGSITLEILDSAIMDSFETITKIGGYIMIFSIFIELFSTFSFSYTPPGMVLLSSLEITNGISLLESLPYSFPVRYAWIMGLCSFGGFCAAAQTGGMLNGSGLHIFPYIIEKLAAAAVTSFISYLYILLFGL